MYGCKLSIRQYVENEITLDFLVEFNPLMEDENEKQVNIADDVSAKSKNKCKIPHGMKITVNQLTIVKNNAVNRTA